METDSQASRTFGSFADPSASGWKLRLAIMFLIAAVYLVGSWHRAVDDSDDALYIHVAQQMLARGDCLTPYADGVRFFDKPPLLYWSLAASFRLLGTTEFAARVPTLLAILVTAWTLMKLGALAASESAGTFAGAFFALSVGTFLFSREAMHDTLLVLFVTLAMYAFLRWYLHGASHRWEALLFYAALAAGALSKSLVAVFLPLAAVLLFLLLRGELSLLRRFAPMAGPVLFLAVAGPWHVLVALKNPGFLSHYFLNEQFLRFFNKREPFDYQSIPVPLFWAFLLLWLFPWTAFLPAALQAVRRPARTTSPYDTTVQLCLIWAGVILFFFSVSSRLNHYSLPLLAPASAAVALALFPANEASRKGTTDRLVRLGFAALALLSAVLFLVAIGGAAWFCTFALPFLNSSEASLQPMLSTTDFGPMFLLPGETRRLLLLPLLGVLAAFVVLPLLAWLLLRRKRRLAAASVLCGMMAVFCLMASLALKDCEPIISSKSFGVILARVYQPGDRVVIDGDYDAANSIQFYAPVRLEVVGGQTFVLDYGLGYPDAPWHKLSWDELQTTWNGPGRLFILLPSELLKSAELRSAYPVLESAGRTLVCNRPVSFPDGVAMRKSSGHRVTAFRFLRAEATLMGDDMPGPFFLVRGPFALQHKNAFRF